MKKKLIITLSIIFLLIVILAIANRSRVNVGMVPSGNIPSQPGATLPLDQPVGSSSTTPPVQKNTDSAIRVEEANNAAQIKNSFSQYIDQNVNDHPGYVADGISQDYPLSDNSGKLVNLDLFLKSVDAKINPKLRNLVGSDYYGFFYCIDANKQKEYGIVFDTGDNNLEKADVYNKQAKEAMKSWEPFMLKDLHNILFPNTSLEAVYLNQAISFTDGQFHSAQIDFPTGKKSIDYTIKDSPTNRIYISTSRDCLKKALDYLFDI